MRAVIYAPTKAKEPLTDDRWLYLVLLVISLALVLFG